MSNPFGFDPSKMDPKVLMELSQLVQQLPSEQLNKMQTMMHNAMAGFDVRAEMAEFERALPPGFREKLVRIMGPGAMAGFTPPTPNTPSSSAPTLSSEAEVTTDMNVHEARMTILRAVAGGRMNPEEAERLLFPT